MASSVTTTAAPALGKKIVVGMTINNVNYNDLMANETVLSDFKASVKRNPFLLSSRMGIGWKGLPHPSPGWL